MAQLHWYDSDSYCHMCGYELHLLLSMIVPSPLLLLDQKLIGYLQYVLLSYRIEGIIGEWVDSVNKDRDRFSMQH